MIAGYKSQELWPSKIPDILGSNLPQQSVGMSRRRTYYWQFPRDGRCRCTDYSRRFTAAMRPLFVAETSHVGVAGESGRRNR
jgi:hypothetical protein